MKSNKVKIKVNCSNMYFMNHLIYNEIKYDSLKFFDDYYILNVSTHDYEKINKFYDSTIIKHYGVNGIKHFVKDNKYLLVSCIWGLFLLSLLQSTIFNVRIDTDDKKLYEIIEKSLIDNGIEKYKKKKSFNEINVIKDKILQKNKDVLEWIEINEYGCNYVVSITKRVDENSNIINNKPSHIVAKKDGLILYITSSKGTKLKSVNDYVKKGDIIISGNIYKNDKIIDTTWAEGEVYGEVWYTVKVDMPLTYTEYVDTKKAINHYYLEFLNNKFTIMGKYDSNLTINEKKVIIDKPYLFFKVVKEKKKIYDYKIINLSSSQAYNEAISRAEASIKKTLSKGEYIIDKKVLKKDVFSSKISIEVFFKVYENMKDTLEIEKWVEENEANNN